MSIRDRRSITCATPFAICSRSVTSTIADSTSLQSNGFLSQTVTCAPDSASFSAIAWPMLFAPPVTIAVFPARSYETLMRSPVSVGVAARRPPIGEPLRGPECDQERDTDCVAHVARLDQEQRGDDQQHALPPRARTTKIADKPGCEAHHTDRGRQRRRDDRHPVADHQQRRLVDEHERHDVRG